MSDDLDWRLLDRHLAGEASPNDEVALQHWLAADPARARELRTLTAVVRTPVDAEWETGRAWSRISARLHEPRLPLHLERRPPAPQRSRGWVAAGAAVVAGGLLVMVWWPAHSRQPAVSAGTAITSPRDRLVLDDVTLGQAAAEIGRRFGVRVDIAEPALAARHVSARFGDDPLPRVLDTISAALGARWTRDGDRVLLEEVH